MKSLYETCERVILALLLAPQLLSFSSILGSISVSAQTDANVTTGLELELEADIDIETVVIINNSTDTKTDADTDGSESLNENESESESESENDEEPNLVMIIVDEFNFRTLGSYRKLMDEQQAYPWGKGVKVDTPNIDRLAEEGALFTNFYTVAPLCTPSRASFMTGLYPQDTGAALNHAPLNEDAVTFAQELRRHSNLYTSYFGKWHLNGDAKPGFNNQKRKFGFVETKYQYNRGHWKFFEDGKNKTTPTKAYEWSASKSKFNDQQKIKEHYATDFMFNKGISFMNRMVKKKRNFAMVLSIADPHAPNIVREPFASKFDGYHFKYPYTGKLASRGTPGTPSWNNPYTLVEKEEVEDSITEYENSEFWQTHMKWYFGMVKLIDVKVGSLLSALEQLGIDDNTIVIFTADHGDQLGLHSKLNKGTPYQSSAGIPFLIRHPSKIRRGKIIETPYSSIDFAPTILSLMGVTNKTSEYHGIDASDELYNDDDISSKDDQIRFVFDTSKKDRWAAAVTNKYKLVISAIEQPWFFDLSEDPEELHNVFDNPTYADEISRMKTALFDESKSFSDTFFRQKDGIILWDTPKCIDSKDSIAISFSKDLLFCKDIRKKGYFSKGRCQYDSALKAHCPRTCGACCDDSEGSMFYSNKDSFLTCSDITSDNDCVNHAVRRFCPQSCGLCD